MNEVFKFCGKISEPMALSILESKGKLVFLFGEYHEEYIRSSGSTVTDFVRFVCDLGVEVTTLIEVDANVKRKKSRTCGDFAVSNIVHDHVAAGLDVVFTDPRAFTGQKFSRVPINASSHAQWTLSTIVMGYEMLTGYNIETMQKTGHGIDCNDRIKHLVAAHACDTFYKPWRCTEDHLIVIEAGLLDLIVLAEIESRGGALVFYGGDTHRENIQKHLIDLGYKLLYTKVSNNEVEDLEDRRVMYSTGPLYPGFKIPQSFSHVRRGLYVDISIVPKLFNFAAERRRWAKNLQVQVAALESELVKNNAALDVAVANFLNLDNAPEAKSGRLRKNKQRHYKRDSRDLLYFEE